MSLCFRDIRKEEVMIECSAIKYLGILTVFYRVLRKCR